MTHRIVVDLGYGDAGKGTTVDWLCRRQPVTAVIRYNGGAQAAHNVVTPDGRHHTFSQFGSGTLAGVRTHLSRFMLVDPFRLSTEAEHLVEIGVPDPMALLTIDPGALLITPYHREVNRAREQEREHRHGSCGIGVGETQSYALNRPEDAPRVGDCQRPAVLQPKLEALRAWAAEEFPHLEAAAEMPTVERLVDDYGAFGGDVQMGDEAMLRSLLRLGPCVFEGAQGVLLDEWYGFHPHTTWSTTTSANAMTLLAEAGVEDDVVTIGVLRTYTTRHGPGPFVTEDAALGILEEHNKTGRWQGEWRVGHFDAVASRYAIEVNGGVDELALTHVDRVTRDLAVCDGYFWQGEHSLSTRIPVSPVPDLAYQEQLTARLTKATPHYVPMRGTRSIEEALDRPIGVTSHGPSAAHKVARYASQVGSR